MIVQLFSTHLVDRWVNSFSIISIHFCCTNDFLFNLITKWYDYVYYNNLFQKQPYYFIWKLISCVLFEHFILIILIDKWYFHYCCPYSSIILFGNFTNKPSQPYFVTFVQHVLTDPISFHHWKRSFRYVYLMDRILYLYLDACSIIGHNTIIYTVLLPKHVKVKFDKFAWKFVEKFSNSFQLTFTNWLLILCNTIFVAFITRQTPPTYVFANVIFRTNFSLAVEI